MDLLGPLREYTTLRSLGEMKKRHKESRGATTGHARTVQSREEKTMPFSRLPCEADRELRVVNSMSGPNRPILDSVFRPIPYSS